ncbi:hypothetical protein HanPI659440_Chr04g0152051 [Helianthus annuus]|nr:hypothetical protein HanPI659440_Chr04g0152051 [Helianthus annuus]
MFFLSFLFSDGLDTVEAVSGEQDLEQNYNGNSSRRNEIWSLLLVFVIRRASLSFLYAGGISIAASSILTNLYRAISVCSSSDIAGQTLCESLLLCKFLPHVWIVEFIEIFMI